MKTKACRSINHKRPSASRFIAGFVCLSLVLACSGCVERKLAINTNPAGAMVMLNDEEIGISPVTASFNWYGDYNITISKPGFQTLHTHRKLASPWYDHFPIDFFAQILYPGRIVDYYEWSFELAPQKKIDRQELIEAARRFGAAE